MHNVVLTENFERHAASAVTAACTESLIIRCAVNARVSLPCQTVRLTSDIDAAAVSMDAPAWANSCSCGLIGCGCISNACTHRLIYADNLQYHHIKRVRFAHTKMCNSIHVALLNL